MAQARSDFEKQKNVETARVAQVKVVELAEHVRMGVPMGSPVFDGAVEADVSAMLRKAGLDPREIRVRQPSLQNLFALVADWSRAA